MTPGPKPNLRNDSRDQAMTAVRQSLSAKALAYALLFACGFVCGLGGEALAASSCDAIAASLNPVENYQNIYGCLSTSEGIARLEAGIFPLSQKITMPARSKLIGKSADHPTSTIVAAPLSNQPWSAPLAQHYANNVVLEVSDDNMVQDLAVTGDGQLHNDCCTTVVAILGSRSQVTNVEIFDLDPLTRQPPQHPNTAKTTGVYFIGSSASGANVVDKALIHDLTLGVVFRAGLPSQPANTFSDSEIVEVYCDGITFSGYGIAKNNLIHSNGFACGQQPISISGAGIYSINNSFGAQIIGNTIADVCGNGLDFANVENFTVENNKVQLKGSPLSGRYSICVGGSPGNFADIRNSKITGNSFNAANTPPLGLFLALFPAYAADTLNAYFPLPEKAKQIIAVRLLKVKNVVTNNAFDSNTMVGTCDSVDACVGIGLYVGPGAGIDSNGISNVSTASHFTRNSVAGSNIGSLRCGADWYAAASICTRAKSEPSCNDDDYQHVPGVNADRFRDDFCVKR